MRPFFIVNPIAGGGKAMEKFNALTEYFKSVGAEFGACFTEAADQSTGLAQEAYDEGERFIVAVGGDGTINEVASALWDKDDVIMGVCPFGTGNDFARVLSLPTEPVEAAKVLLEGEPQPVDIGMAGDKPFINVGGLGFDVDVVINTERYKGRFRGMLPYLFGIVRSMIHLNKVPVKLTADGETIEESVLILSVGNGSHIGGGMAALPEADAQDGLFDVCMVKKVGMPTFLHLLPKFIKGKHLGTKPVRYFRAKEVKIECARTPMQLDGELGEYAPVTFRIVPGALKIMLPKKQLTVNS